MICPAETIFLSLLLIDEKGKGFQAADISLVYQYHS